MTLHKVAAHVSVDDDTDLSDVIDAVAEGIEPMADDYAVFEKVN